jgi:hypothetical protein
MFLDYVTRDFFAAVALLARRARGDYGPDKWSEQFPRSQVSVDPSLTPWSLFECMKMPFGEAHAEDEAEEGDAPQ